MKILHFGDFLPDPRIERAALIGRRMGHSCYYLGRGIRSIGLETDIFKEEYKVTIKPRNKAGMGRKELLSAIKNAITEVDPDIIHAHDIYNANMIYQLHPERLVYDDHEYWSRQVKQMVINRIYRIIPEPKSLLLKLILLRRIPKWEKELREHAVIIASSTKVLEFHLREKSRNVFLLPNMPLLSEVSGIDFNQPPEDKLICAYLGGDISKKRSSPHRNTDGLVNIFKDKKTGHLLVIGDDNLQSNEFITSMGRVSHIECYRQLSKAQIGLHGFRPHPALSYKGSNKVHMYIHAGCVPFVTAESLHFYENKGGMVVPYNDFNDLKDKIIKNKNKIMETSPDEIRKWARENFILDKYANNLKLAYREVGNTS